MGEDQVHQLVFDLSEEEINELGSRPAPVREPSKNLWEVVYQLSDILNKDEIAICDELHYIDDTDLALEGFLSETTEMRAKYCTMGQVAIDELIKKYIPIKVTEAEIIPLTRPAMTQQVVLRKPSNRPSNARPKTVRFRTRQHPSQGFRNR